MNKEEQTIQETTAADTADTNSTDDPSVIAQEQSIDTQTASETDTATESSDANSATDKTDDDSQASPESEVSDPTTQSLTSEAESALVSALAEINQHLGVLQAFFEKQSAHTQELPPLQRESARIDQRLANLHELFKNQIARNQNQRQMFDTIYREMKDYKENSLMEAFHKPIIHNLIQFYDNFVGVESQLDDIGKTIDAFADLFDDEAAAKQLSQLRPKERTEDLTTVWRGLKRRLSNFRNNMENVRIELEEVLYRIDVEPYAERLNELDRKLHKTIKTIPTDDPDKHQAVATIHKIGFYWREKIFRPEEVTIFRYTQPVDKDIETASEETVGENPTKKKGDETDG